MCKHKITNNKILISLGEYQGKKVIIDMNKLSNGLITGISGCRKEELVFKIKEQIKEKGEKSYSINAEYDSIKKCKHMLDTMFNSVNKLREYDLSDKKHIFFFIENVNNVISSNPTLKEFVIAKGIEKLLQIKIEKLHIHIIMSTYSGLSLCLPERFFKKLDFIITGYTPDIEESQYLLGNNQATELYYDIPNIFILKVEDKLNRFRI